MTHTILFLLVAFRFGIVLALVVRFTLVCTTSLIGLFNSSTLEQETELLHVYNKYK